MTKQPKTVTLSVDDYYNRLAWHEYQGDVAAAVALHSLALYFDPPMDVDEGRVSDRVLKYREDAKRINNPSTWP